MWNSKTTSEGLEEEEGSKKRRWETRPGARSEALRRYNTERGSPREYPEQGVTRSGLIPEKTQVEEMVEGQRSSRKPSEGFC